MLRPLTTETVEWGIAWTTHRSVCCSSAGLSPFCSARSSRRVSCSGGSGVECFSATSASPIVESLLSGSGECGTSPVNPFCGNKTPILVDPNNINRLYVGCRQLWRTQGARTASPSNITWTPINWTGATPPTVNFVINAMDIPRGDANLMWVGTMHAFGGSDPSVGVAGQLWRSTNAATNAPIFTQMNIGKGLPARPVFDVAIDPRPDATGKFKKVYVSYAGFAPDNVWMTPDDGATWSPIGAGLPAVPVWAIAVHPTKPGWLYAGTDVGLYTSTDDGATWSATTRGPATVAISDLQWKDNARLTVATYGRGVHELDATPNPELLFPETAQVPVGSLTRGRVENLLLSDDKRLVLSRPSFSQNLTSVLTTRGGFTTSATPVGSNLEFSIESLASQDVDQTSEWFDFLNNQFVTMQIVRLTAGQERTTTRVFATGASRFISPTTRQLQARLTWTPVKAGSMFSVEMDAARWKITRP
jgi:hypothetical protein